MFVRRQLGIAVAGFAIGAIAALLLGHGGEQGSDGQRWNAVAHAPSTYAQPSQVLAATQDVSASIDQLGHETARARHRSAHQGNARRTPTYEDDLRNAMEYADTLRANAEVSETRRLLAAGFSQERIDALRQRRDELLKQREQVKDDPSSFSLVLDRDLVLRDEMSDVEYMRYRQAVLRPTSVGVEKVYSGSNAETAGILPGDQVAKYDGRRVFDFFELDALARSRTSSEPAIVELLRDGQAIEVRLSKGPTGIGVPSVNATSARILNLLNVD